MYVLNCLQQKSWFGCSPKLQMEPWTHFMSLLAKFAILSASCPFEDTSRGNMETLFFVTLFGRVLVVVGSSLVLVGSSFYSLLVSCLASYKELLCRCGPVHLWKYLFNTHKHTMPVKGSHVRVYLAKSPTLSWGQKEKMSVTKPEVLLWVIRM